MSAPRPLEERILSPALQALARVADSVQTRLEILEGASSVLGGFSLEAYRRAFESPSNLTVTQAIDNADGVLRQLRDTGIPVSLALCALGRPHLSLSQQRFQGAFYTDFRLAQFVAASVADSITVNTKVIDPAAGSGILLAAVAQAAHRLDHRRRATWLAESVTACDLSSSALRAARLALASFTDDIGSISAMFSQWRCQDSLLSDSIGWGGFDLVVGNPPWEKIKLTRHEFLKANGGNRHYGDDYSPMNNEVLIAKRAELGRYSNQLVSRYPLLGGGEPDLYKAFIELFIGLSRPGGRVSVIVPAGLIRSQGTETLRRFLFENTGDLSFTVLENRARFFAIDTRFKFLTLSLTKAVSGYRDDRIEVLHARGTDTGVSIFGSASLKKSSLAEIRSDLTVPEVRSEQEWSMFKTMSELAQNVLSSTSPWYAQIVREVDMTRDRRHFSRHERTEHIPLIEGRMVHQHRFGAKTYSHGTGRRSRWGSVPYGEGRILPQFWFPLEELAPAVRARIQSVRAGFCDITGQTNERSMLAALVAPGVVCGNKVPTVVFPNDPTESRLMLWIAIVNSVTFDWALRRLVTTTVNYFLLNSVPFPDIEPDTVQGRRLVHAGRELGNSYAGHAFVDPWQIGRLRAMIDISVHAAYGVGFRELEVMLGDFPLLDRGQPPILGESRSTITRDFLLSNAADFFGVPDRQYRERAEMGRESGAAPYVPSEYVGVDVGEAEEAGNG